MAASICQMGAITVPERLFDLAKEQDGYFTTTQAAELGVDATAISKAAARGRIEHVSRGVYRMTRFPHSPSRAHLWEAVLWPQAASNVRGVLSHATALAVHGLADPNPQNVQLTVPKSFRVRRDLPAWLSLHRADLEEGDLVSVDGLPVTSVKRSVRDAVPTLGPESISALRSKLEMRGYDLEDAEAPNPATPPRRSPRKVSRHDEEGAASIFPPSQVPSHFAQIAELDITRELIAPRVPEPWFTLAAWTGRKRTENLEIVSERRSLLIRRDEFPLLFDELSYTGNVLSDLGAPGGVVSYDRSGKSYSYAPFHTFHFRSSEAAGEPVAFVRDLSNGLAVMLNPDIILYLGLEERAKGSGVWIDPRTGTDVIVQSKQDALSEAKIRTPYLRNYLRARQMCLLIGQFQRRLYFNPSRELMESYETGDSIIGAPRDGAKALVLSTESARQILSMDPFLRRELHLWYQVEPPQMDVDHAFEEEPPFDIYSFTLPTSEGPVAPARFRDARAGHKKDFDGVYTDFMNSVYFSQEVLRKYEGADGFIVEDNGSVRCGPYWALNRSTARIGNDLLRTSIGDFAQGVPFEEWPHWALYAAEPPSSPSSYGNEPTIPDSVNKLAESLQRLNYAFELFSSVLGASLEKQLWGGTLDSLAGRQLKWYYPHNASDDEFLKRAVLLSTFVNEELSSNALRTATRAIAPQLHLGDDGKPLGSRRLLERLALVATLTSTTKTFGTALSDLVAQAEGADGADPELLGELRALRKVVRDNFAPIAFLYDLRNSSGVAHAGSLNAARQAAINLGLTAERWGRSEYLSLLRDVGRAVDGISSGFRSSALTLANLFQDKRMEGTV
jgi:hypothetical protein